MNVLFARRHRWWPLLIGSLLLTCDAAEAAGRHKQVMVLYSTRREAQISILGDRLLPGVLGEGLDEGLTYLSEYIDADRFSDPAYEEAFSDFLRRKYAGERFDLILTIQNAATVFVNKYRKDLFGDVPLVFLTNFPEKRMADSTGVLITPDFTETLTFAETIETGLRHVFLVNGAGTSDRLYERTAREQLRRFESRLDITYLSGLPTKDLETRVRTLPPHSIVYILMVYKDGTGRNFNPVEYGAHIATIANAPTYSWVDSLIGRGIVGGSLLSQDERMKTVGRLARRVLNGEAADGIPIASPNADTRQVDWRQLKRWGISESRLPAGTIVQFREPTLWSRYRRYVLGSAALLFAQGALVVGLLVQRVRRRRAEDRVRASREELRVTYSRIRDLGGRLLAAQEAERSRVARDLHDDVSQQVALMIIDLELLCGAAPDLHVDAATMVRSAVNRAHALVKTVHQLSHRLHPARLQLIGLVAALDGLQQELARTSLSISFECSNVPTRIPPDIALCLFRIAQEALQNAVKHSQARAVRLQLIGDPQGVLLIVADDGVGFDPDDALAHGVGLASMRERIESIGGSLTIRSRPAAGTRIEVAVTRSSATRPPRVEGLRAALPVAALRATRAKRPVEEKR